MMQTRVLPRIALVLGLALVGIAACSTPGPTPSPSETAEGPPPGAAYEGKAFEFERVRDGVFHAVGTGALAVGCNGSIVVGDRDALVVDSHISPAAAWALLRELPEVTDRPVRYVVNTHFHFDHVHGNEVFPPDVEILGHELTRAMIVAGRTREGRAYESFIGTLPDQIAEAEARLAEASPEEREALEKRVELLRRYKEATDAVTPTPPTMTLTDKVTLYRGGREIQLLFLGRGHTGGDVVVYLPADRVVITGDLLTESLPYMGDAYPLEWIDTLERLEALDFDVVLPGHGRAFEGKEKIGHLQAYLRDLWDQAKAFHDEGVPAEEAAERIDLTAHAEHYPDRITGPGAHPHAVLRIYELLDEAGADGAR